MLLGNWKRICLRYLDERARKNQNNMNERLFTLILKFPPLPCVHFQPQVIVE